MWVMAICTGKGTTTFFKAAAHLQPLRMGSEPKFLIAAPFNENFEMVGQALSR